MGTSLSGRLRAPLVCLATLGVALAVSSPALAVAAAQPTPIDLFNGYQACSTDVNSPTYLSSGTSGLVIEGLAQDPSGSGPQLTEQFQVSPVSDPTQTTTLSNDFVSSGFEGTVTVPVSDLSDGQTYSWQAQDVGASGTSAWSAPCYCADVRGDVDPDHYSGQRVVRGLTILQARFGKETTHEADRTRMPSDDLHR